MNSSQSEIPTGDVNKRILDGLAAIGIIIDGSCTVFLFNEFRYPKSPLRSPYFIILTIGFIINMLILVARIAFISSNIPPEISWLSIYTSFAQWFSQNGLGICIFYLGLNRCTAIMLPTMHTKVS